MASAGAARRSQSDPLPGSDGEPAIEGVGLTRFAASRCAHWHSELDVLALQSSCCGKFYACASCHDECEDHPLQPWPADTPLDTEAQMCGVCRQRISILAYINGPDPPACPNPQCRAPMNPGCKLHWPLYFSRGLIAKAQAAGSAGSPKPLPQTAAGGPRNL